MELLKLIHRETPNQKVLLKNRGIIAKVAQEEAIAKRIKNSAEVEIVECALQGTNETLGIQINEISLAAGARSSGNLILKRTIIFRGKLTDE